MKKQFLVAATVASILFSACQSTQKAQNNDSKKTETTSENTLKDISYTVAKNYFVKNTIKKIDNPKFETQESFESTFGMAATMGENGMPTNIDFSKQYVIAVMLPETDLQTSVDPVSLQKKENGEIILTYKTVRGAKQSYTTTPSFAIIVDKSENGKLTLKEIN